MGRVRAGAFAVLKGVWGFIAGSSPGLLFVLWASWENPFFLDMPWLVLGLALAPGLLVGALWRRPGPQAALAVPLALWAGAVMRPEPAPVAPRLLVIGVDGATWERIDALELPALEALQADGQRAILTSMEPMFSPLLWTTMASGKPPNEHGIRGFRVRSDQARVPRLWDIAEAEGLSVGVWKWLVTWPPRQVDGFMVPAWLATTPETWPPELSVVKELELANRQRRTTETRRSLPALALAGVQHGVRASTLVAAAGSLFADEPRVERDLVRGRIDRDVFVWALHRHQPELATFTYYATDGLQHSHWGLPPADRAYRQADLIVGELVRRVSPDTTVVVLSDHGFQSFEGPDERLVPTTEALKERLSQVDPEVQVHRLGIKLVVTGDVFEELKALQDERGVPVFQVEALEPDVYGLTLTREELSVEALEAATAGGEPMKNYARYRETTDRGDHHPDGIFLVRGGEGTLPSRIGLLDVAPTLYALLGIPPAQDLPGEVVVGPTQRGPATRDGLIETLDWGDWDVDEPLVDEEALRRLGYVE